MLPTQLGPCLSSAWLDLSGLIYRLVYDLARRARPMTREGFCE